MQHTSTLGLNRTGAQAAHADIDEMQATAEQLSPDLPSDGEALAAMRRAYIAEAARVGSVPVPGTLKGVVKTTLAKATGSRPETFIDKLGERLAFERSGTRLYEALITKCEALDEGPAIDVDRLRQFRDEEARHFKLLVAAMETLGADPTAQTPCADVSGVASLGLMQVIDDPRTDVAHCLNAVLIAELADHAGWELLIELARTAGHPDLAEQFEAALGEEMVHQQTIRAWLQQTVLSQA